MDHAAWLARIFGPFFLIIGLWVIFCRNDIKKIWNTMKKDPGLICLGGIINLLIGCTILSTYRTWSLELAVLLTILGWMQVIRGVVVLFAPQKFISFAVACEPHWEKLVIIPLFFGVCLTYLGFFA